MVSVCSKAEEASEPNAFGVADVDGMINDTAAKILASVGFTDAEIAALRQERFVMGSRKVNHIRCP